MGYQLGVDLGTTYTAAAIARDGLVEVASLGTRSSAVPSVLFFAEQGELLVGDAANRRGLTDPSRVVREFKRRFGDPIPNLVAGTPISADILMAKLLRWVVDTIAAQQGELPEAVAVSHPANWGPYKLELLAQTFSVAGLGEPLTLTEPEAAAMAYASTERVETDEVVAVYDLGGGTFDAAVLRKNHDGFEILGRPEGIERLGGIDFDEAVYGYVANSVADVIEQLDPEDPGDRAAMARLRDECTDAKEALSSDTDVRIPVLLTYRREVRLTRGEFEDMIRPALEPTIGALKRTIASAGIEPEAIKSVLLVGGSSRIPLIGQLLASELGRPVSIDVHPKHAVATGAALFARARVGASPVPVGAGVAAPPPPPPSPPPAPPPPPAPVAAPPPPPPPAPVAPETQASPSADAPEPPPTPPPRRRRLPGPVVAAAAVSLIVVAAGILVATGGEGDDDNGVSDAEQRIAEAREGSATTDAPTSAPTTTAPAPVAGETDRAVQRRLEFFMNFELSYYYSHGGRWATTSEQILDNYMANYSGLRTPEYLPVSAVIEAPVPVLPPTVVVTQVRDKTLFTASVSEGGTCLYKRFTPGNNAPGNEYARHRGTPCPSVFDVGYNGDSSAWYRG